jgi:hypothetical protein
VNALLQALYVGVVVMGALYLLVPARVHRFGFESLRSGAPGADSTEISRSVRWFYRLLGALFVTLGGYRLLQSIR